MSSSGRDLRNFEKVVNQSFVLDGPHADSTDQRWDNFVSKRGTIFVSALGNIDDNNDGINGRPATPATAYNVIAVAAYDNDLTYSGVGPTREPTPGATPGPTPRSKPDITAPERVTSYSSPQVAGAATLLVQAAPTPSAKDPRTVKALLLNGAVKPLYTRNPAYAWIRHTEAQPLDWRHGAGIVNAFNSYRQLQAGQRTPDTGVGPLGLGLASNHSRRPSEDLLFHSHRHGTLQRHRYARLEPARRPNFNQ